MAKQNKGLAPVSPAYEIVGLAPATNIPISFGGRDYDLANLTPEDAAYLLQFPEQVPYLKLKEFESQATGV